MVGVVEDIVHCLATENIALGALCGVVADAADDVA